MTDKVDSIAKIVYDVAIRGFSQFPSYWPSWENCPDSSSAKKAALMAAMKIDCLSRDDQKRVSSKNTEENKNKTVNLEEALVAFEQGAKITVHYRGGIKEKINNFYHGEPHSNYEQFRYWLNYNSYRIDGAFCNIESPRDIVAVDIKYDARKLKEDKEETLYLAGEQKTVNLETALNAFNDGLSVEVEFRDGKSKKVSNFEKRAGVKDFPDHVYWIDGLSYAITGKYNYAESCKDVVKIIISE